MSPLWAVLLGWALGASEGLGDAGAKQPSPSPHEVSARSGRDLREAVHRALRRWARPSEADADPAAREFLTLFDQLQRDSELPSAQREYLQQKVRIRLLELSDQIALRIARQKRQADAEQAASVALPADKAQPLAQQMGMAPLGPQARAGMPFANAMQPEDAGQALIDLIQKTIRPQSWDVNGGPGSIYYWYPGRALVIRQTDEVHQEIGGLLDQLQRAGR